MQLELSKWLAREVSEEKADEVIAFTQFCVIARCPTAADLSRQHKLATADAIVCATALEHKADIITCVAHFEGLQGVVLITKPGRR